MQGQAMKGMEQGCTVKKGTGWHCVEREDLDVCFEFFMLCPL